MEARSSTYKQVTGLNPVDLLIKHETVGELQIPMTSTTR